VGFASNFEDNEERRSESTRLKTRRPDANPDNAREDVPPGMARVPRWIFDGAHGWRETHELVIKCSA